MKQVKHWQDPVNVLLGVWMILSPWVLGFHEVRNAVIATVLTGVVVMVLALWVLATDKDYAWTKKPAH